MPDLAAQRSKSASVGFVAFVNANKTTNIARAATHIGNTEISSFFDMVFSPKFSFVCDFDF